MTVIHKARPALYVILYPANALVNQELEVVPVRSAYLGSSILPLLVAALVNAQNLLLPKLAMTLDNVLVRMGSEF